MNNFFQHAASQKPSKVYLECDRPVGYGELAQTIGRLTTFLESTPLQAGDRVVIASSDDAWLAALFFALIDNGMTAVIMDSHATEFEFTLLCSAAGVNACIVDEDIIRRCLPDNRGFKLVLPIRAEKSNRHLIDKLLGKKNRPGTSNTFPAILDGHTAAAPAGRFDAQRIAYIVLTSGSTDHPKAVPTTWHALASHLRTLQHQFGYDEHTRILNLLPLSHADGLIQGPAIACFCGGILLRHLGFNIQNIAPILHSIYAKRVTHLVCVPTILALMQEFGAQFPESFESEGFEFVISTAGKLEEPLWMRFQTTFNVRVVNVYGLTETVAGGLFCGPDEESFRCGSIGKPVHCEAMIVDEGGNAVVPGQTGELLLRGSNVFSGYLGDDGANTVYFINGWLRTGDLARKDPDGFYHIAGRIKNVVVSGGHAIYPEETNEVIVRHPDVVDAATFGVEHPQWGEILAALLVPAPNSRISLAEVAAWCRHYLSEFKVPKDLRITGSLPYGPSGKVVLPEAKRLYAALGAAAPRVDGADTEARLLELAAGVFRRPVEALNLYSSPTNTPGWDSLAHMSLAVAIESEFGIRLSTRDIMNITSLNSVLKLVMR